MSAPQTNIEKQERRHKPSLIGIAVSVIAALLLLAAFLFYVFANGEAPVEPEATVDGRTGEIEATE